MKRWILLSLALLPAVAPLPTHAQSPSLLETPRLGAIVSADLEAALQPPLDQVVPTARRSSGAAFGLSLLAPGLGHRYAAGQWGGAGTTHALADVALWVGLLDANARLGRAVDSYEALAAVGANAQLEGQGRGFFLNLARYRSSEAYVDALLRERRWDALADAQRPENQWIWVSEEDFQRYGALREDAESLRRRRPVYAALLAGNRLLASIGAFRTARRINRAEVTAALGPPLSDRTLPTVHLSVRF